MAEGKASPTNTLFEIPSLPSTENEQSAAENSPLPSTGTEQYFASSSSPSAGNEQSVAEIFQEGDREVAGVQDQHVRYARLNREPSRNESGMDSNTEFESLAELREQHVGCTGVRRFFFFVVAAVLTGIVITAIYVAVQLRIHHPVTETSDTEGSVALSSNVTDATNSTLPDN